MEQKYNSNIQDKQICVSASVMRSRYISQRAKLVYGYLCSRYIEAGKGEIPRKEICAELGITQDTLGKALNQLEENHFIKRQEAKTTDRKYANNKYFISFDNNIPIPDDNVTNNDIPISSESVTDKNIPMLPKSVTDKNIPVSSGNAMDTHNNSITDVLDTDIDIVSEKPTTDNTDITSSVIDTIPIHTEKVMDTDNTSILSESVTDTDNIPIPCSNILDNKIVSIPYSSVMNTNVTVVEDEVTVDNTDNDITPIPREKIMGNNNIPVHTENVTDTNNDIPIHCNNATDNNIIPILPEKISDNNIPVSSDNVSDNDSPIPSNKVTNNNSPIPYRRVIDTVGFMLPNDENRPLTTEFF